MRPGFVTVYVLVQVLSLWLPSVLADPHLTDNVDHTSQVDRPRHHRRSRHSGDSPGYRTSQNRRRRRQERERERAEKARRREQLTTVGEDVMIEDSTPSQYLAEPHPEPPVCDRDCMITRDLRKHHRMESIKEDILRKLKLDAPVNITRKSHVVMPRVPFIDRIMESMMQGDQGGPIHYLDEDLDDDRATTLRVFSFAEPSPPEKGINDSQVCFFRFSKEVERNHVKEAKFGVFIKPPVVPQNMRVTYILIYLLLPTRTDEPGHYTESLIVEKKIDLTSPRSTRKWYEFDLTEQVNHWLLNPERNYGLKIMASDSQGSPLAIINPTNESEEPWKPYFALRLGDKSRSRTKRRLRLDCDEHSNETRCCRYPLEIDFNSFKWDFIIAPKRYSAYYCAGECPFSYFQKYPHAHVFENTKPKDAGGPCCSPEKLSPITMLYFDAELSINIDTLPGMVVDRCGCAS